MEQRDKDINKNKERQTPIIDGDARPDINIDPENATNEELENVREKGKTTKNRVDTNSLEDFRDAK